MRIENGSVVTLNFQVTDPEGNLLDDGQEPMVYLHGDQDQLFPKLQAVLEGKTVGDTAEAVLAPEDAFGEYDPELVRVEPRSAFQPDLAAGMQLMGGPEGEEPQMFTVMDILDDQVALDGNHPLAGMTLAFSCKVLEVRPASPEELEGLLPS